MSEWKSQTHPLAHPITVGAGPQAQTITEVTLREPDMEALEAMQDAGVFGKADNDGPKELTVRQVRVCIVALSKLPDDTVKRLHFKDVRAISERLGPLFVELAEDAQPSGS